MGLLVAGLLGQDSIGAAMRKEQDSSAAAIQKEDYLLLIALRKKRWRLAGALRALQTRLVFLFRKANKRHPKVRRNCTTGALGGQGQVLERGFYSVVAWT